MCETACAHMIHGMRNIDMMGKTHVAAGIAASLAIMQPSTIGGCFTAVLGGAFGGMICDVECRSAPRRRDALVTRLIVLIIFGAIYFADTRMNAGITAALLSEDRAHIVAGAAILIITAMIGRATAHRTFTHSLLYMLLITVGSGLIYPPISGAVLAGMASHIALDLLNKRPMQLLYPFKWGACLRLCYADGVVNSLILSAAIAADAIMLAYIIRAMRF